MRRFIVTNPNLSVAKAGAVVDADQLRMDDEKLDEWVAAGYAMELFDDWNYAPAVDHTAGLTGTAADDHVALADEDAQAAESDVFDPAEHNVDKVLDYMSENPHDAVRVIEAEIAGKNRSGIVKADLDG